MMFKIVRPCKGAYDALPAEHLELDLKRCSKKLSEIGYEEVVNARVMLVVKKEIEVSIYPNGKLLLKTDSKRVAEKVSDEIFKVLRLMV